jgi:hypothetical protein
MQSFSYSGTDAIRHQIIIPVSQTDYSIIPELQHSNLGGVPFCCICLNMQLSITSQTISQLNINGR